MEPWRAFLVRGIIAVLAGVAVMAWPGKSAELVVMLVGVFAVVTGLIAVIASASARHVTWGTSVAAGVVTVAMGLVALVAPAFAAAVFIYMVAAWAFVFGLLHLAVAGALHGKGAGEVLALGLLGIISIAFALMLFIRPGAGVVAVSLMVGIYLVMIGGVIIQHALMARSQADAANA